LLPPEADDIKVRNSHEIHTISVHASSKIESKVRQVLSVLEQPETTGDKKNKDTDTSRTKSVIVALTARARAGNKCITVAEIAKREMSKSGGTCWQYTGCWTRLETLENTHEQQKLNRDQEAAEAGVEEAAQNNSEPSEGDEEPYFESRKAAERKMVRNTVCLVVYISREPVRRLKELYGEQVIEAKKA